MATPRTYTIHEEPNEIDDNLLDILGGNFNFDHVKGLSEWLKNAVDAYIRANTADKDQLVYFRFTDGKNGTATIECIDFNGMTHADVESALKRWGDPEASKRGIKNLKTFGGHGNGGKFYMRQMFKKSQYITYKNGLLNVFGFSENKKYGFAEDMKNKPMSPADALAYAGLDKSYFPKEAQNKVLQGDTGFTVVQGVGPATMPNVIKVGIIANQLRNHPQSQRILDHIPSKVIYNESVFKDSLSSENLTPLPGFEVIEPVQVPAVLIYESHHDRQEITMSNAKYPAGTLQLRTSEVPMQKSGKYGELNRIDIIGEMGVVGSYKLQELGVTFMPQYAYIYGELECPILEDPAIASVDNDRVRLIDNPTSKVLLEWVGQQIIELCKKIAEQEKAERAEKIKDISSTLNSYLNQWKDKFMSKILAEVLAGAGPGTGTGSGGSGGSGGNGGTGSGTGKDTPGPQGSGGDGGGDTPKKANRSPKVLLSGIDEDPFPPFEQISLTARQSVVYQRPKDVDEGIYWINTSAPIAKSILERYDQNSPRWRDYLFQRYVDIFVKEALTSLQKRDPDEFNAANVDNAIGEIVQRIHQAAAEELGSFLFEDSFSTGE